ncbi:MAG: hypothetical protein H0T48_00920 [Gemmatimonadaceae bacterium]|nr:hypothetical protein [Gemmatimonadaceae bacterium]
MLNFRARGGSSAPLCVWLCVSMVFSVSRLSGAQESHEHKHGSPLHFSHPIFTESPSPDTKLRFDYLFLKAGGHDTEESLRDHTFQAEGEYAFNPSVSIEVKLPFTRRASQGTTVSSTGSGEIALKLASFAAADRGILLGGGVELGLPTGSERKGIGSDRLYQLEPFLDLGYQRGAFEFVTFLSYGTILNRDDADPREDEVELASSALYRVSPRFETLVEMAVSRVVSGDERGEQAISAGPSFKYRVQRVEQLVFGIAARFPVTEHREFEREFIVSALYHF